MFYIGAVHLGLFIAPSLEIDSLETFIEAAKAAPGKFEYGSSGVGSWGHIIAEQFVDVTGAELFHIDDVGGLALPVAPHRRGHAHRRPEPPRRIVEIRIGVGVERRTTERERRVKDVGGERKGVVTTAGGTAMGAVEQAPHPRTGALGPGAPLLGRRRAPIGDHQHEGQHDDKQRRPLAVEELRVGGRGRMLVIGEDSGRQRRLERQHAQHDSARRGEVAPVGNVVGEAPVPPHHEINTRLRGRDPPQPLRGGALNDRANLALRIDEQRASDAPRRRMRKRSHEGEHRRDALARPRVAKRQGVTREDCARDLSRRRVQRRPVRNGEPWGASRTRARRLRVADVVDEPQDAGDGRGDRHLAAAEGFVDRRKRGAILRANRAAHHSLEQPGEPARGAWAGFGTRGERGGEAVEDGQIGRVDFRRDRHHAAGVDERTADEPGEKAIVKICQIGEQHRRGSRGNGGIGAHAEEVIDERCTRLGDPLVTEREQQRRGARRTVDDARAHPDASGAPALMRSEVVLEGGRDAAERRDLKFDQIVEVDPVQHVDRLDEIDGGLKVELTGKTNDAAVAAVLEIGHGTLLA